LNISLEKKEQPASRLIDAYIAVGRFRNSSHSKTIHA